MMVNINDNVHFRLTPDGIDAIKEWDSNCRYAIASANLDIEWMSWFDRHPPDEKGYRTEQLWELFAMFGYKMVLGGPIFFEKNVIQIPGPSHAMTALRMIRECGGNYQQTAQWMQKVAAWGMEPDIFDKPEPLRLGGNP